MQSTERISSMPSALNWRISIWKDYQTGSNRLLDRKTRYIGKCLVNPRDLRHHIFKVFFHLLTLEFKFRSKITIEKTQALVALVLFVAIFGVISQCNLKMSLSYTKLLFAPQTFCLALMVGIVKIKNVSIFNPLMCCKNINSWFYNNNVTAVTVFLFTFYFCCFGCKHSCFLQRQWPRQQCTGLLMGERMLTCVVGWLL